jgi:Flp pilus assembly CpaE family ATPase
VKAAFPGLEVVAVPHDPKIVEADRKGIAPIDLAPDAPAVRALVGLASSLYPSPN